MKGVTNFVQFWGEKLMEYAKFKLLIVAIVILFNVSLSNVQAAEALPASGKVELMLGVNSNMPTTVYVPNGNGPRPMILVIHTSGGLRKGEHEYAEALSKIGFLSIVPDFYAPYELTVKKKKLTWTKYQTEIHNDFKSIISDVKKLSQQPIEKVFAVGFSNGGYWSAMLAAASDIDAGVSYYGAYTEGGTCRKPDLESCSILSATNSGSSPLLSIHGEDDKVVKIHLAEAFEGLYRFAAGDEKLEVQHYDDANHAFNLKYNYKGKYYNEEVSRMAWEKTLEFLKKYGSGL